LDPEPSAIFQEFGTPFFGTLPSISLKDGLFGRESQPVLVCAFLGILLFFQFCNLLVVKRAISVFFF